MIYNKAQPTGIPKLPLRSGFVTPCWQLYVFLSLQSNLEILGTCKPLQLKSQQKINRKFDFWL